MQEEGAAEAVDLSPHTPAPLSPAVPAPLTVLAARLGIGVGVGARRRRGGNVGRDSGGGVSRARQPVKMELAPPVLKEPNDGEERMHQKRACDTRLLLEVPRPLPFCLIAADLSWVAKKEKRGGISQRSRLISM